MAEKWRRCGTCRRVKAVEDFDGDEQVCTACLTAPIRRTRASAVTSRRLPGEPDADPSGAGSAAGATGAAAASSGTAARAVVTVAARDLRGRGDPEVRSRRARVRALDRLAQEYPDDFARLLAEERRSEGLT